MENILCKVRDLYRGIGEFEENMHAKFGISLNEGMLLCCIYTNGIMSSTELSKVLGLTPSNMSKVIRQVESRGYIKRIVGVEDKRTMRFDLNDSGKEMLMTIKAWDCPIPENLHGIID